MSTRRTLLLSAALCAAAILPVQAAPELGARLIDAAHQDDAIAVTTLLKAHAPVNTAQADGATALSWAAANSDLPMVKQLLAAGADPNRANDYGVTPLNLAVTIGNVPVGKALLDAHAKADLATWTGETPLMFAARNGSVELMRALVSHGANVNGHETRHGQTALMWAAAAGKTDAVKFLIANKVNVNALTPKVHVEAVSDGAPNGFTTTLPMEKGGLNALMFAAGSQAGNNEIVDALIAAGTPVNKPAADGTTPLLFSLFRHVNPTFIFPHDTEILGDPAMAEDLVKHGANPSLADANGITPLIAAAFNAVGGDHGAAHPHNAVGEAETKMLLANGADPNPALKDYMPLESLGQDVRFPARFMNISAFMLDAAYEKTALVKLILASGRFKVNQTRAGGNTPLMDAVMVDSLPAVQVLVGAGADVNAVNPVTGQTAMHLAAIGPAGTGEIVKYLVDHGGRMDTKDTSGKTPVDVAKTDTGLNNKASIFGGSVVDALISVKNGKAVAPDKAVISTAIMPPTYALIMTRSRREPPGVTGKDALLALAAGKPIPVPRSQRAKGAVDPDDPAAQDQVALADDK